MIRTVREWLALALLCVLPLHALLVTVLTKMIAGPGHAPLASLALWKEGVLAVLLTLAFVELWPRIVSSDDRDSPWSMDSLDWCVVFGLLLAVVTSYVVGAQSTSFANLLHLHFSSADKRFLVGLKYDFLPLFVFVALRRVPWSDAWLRRALVALVGVGTIIGAYALVTLFLPDSFFTNLGYSDQHSLYFANGPLAAFQQVEGSAVRRAQSTLSGPNQLGLWLLIPLSSVLFLCVAALRRRLKQGVKINLFSSVALFIATLAVLIGIGLSLSRTAWVAAALMILAMLVMLAIRSVRSGRHQLLCVGTLVVVLLGIGGGGYGVTRFMPNLVIRLQSGSDHLAKPLAAIATMRAHPFGLGLGTAGPASNAFSDTCVFLPLGADFRWANGRTDICVFIGSARKLPPGKVCECPVLTENWYLQEGVEMGYLGFLFSVVLALFILFPLLRTSIGDPTFAPLLAFFGLSVAGLLLHSFEDSAVAYTTWILLAAAIPVALPRK